MPAIAIVGAGPGLGLAIARQFGGKGFDVALIARNREKLEELVGALAADGITAAGFTADVTDRSGLGRALSEAAERFGGIDVLEYSPAPKSGPHTAVDVRETNPENTQAQIEYYLYGGMAAAEAVLPAMREAGVGTLMFTTGGGSMRPVPMFGNVNAAAGALRNWALNLGAALEDEGVHIAHVAISVWIGDTAPEGMPSLPASAIAPKYWELYEDRATSEVVVAP